MEEDVRDSLSSRSAVTAWAGDIWHSSGEEEVVEPDLLCPQLYQQRTLPLRSSLVDLKNLLGRCGRVSVGCAALCVCAPLRYPCPLCMGFAPSFHFDLMVYYLGGASGGGLLRPFSLHPVASLAALSTASFPGMPTWAGIHLTVTVRPLSWTSWTCRAMSARM
jgi:hypothetical protein